jgi:hypothetical protein
MLTADNLDDDDALTAAAVLKQNPHYTEAQAEMHARAFNAAAPLRALAAGTPNERYVAVALKGVVDMLVATVPAQP